MYEGIPDTTATKYKITEDQLAIFNDIKNTIGPYVIFEDVRVMTPTK